MRLLLELLDQDGIVPFSMVAEPTACCTVGLPMVSGTLAFPSIAGSNSLCIRLTLIEAQARPLLSSLRPGVCLPRSGVRVQTRWDPLTRLIRLRMGRYRVRIALAHAHAVGAGWQ